MNKFFHAIGLAVLMLPATSTLAHDMQQNRARLVLRENTHIAVTLYIAYGDALHLALAPQQPINEFLTMYSAMSPDRLQKELLRAQQKFETGTRIYLASGAEIPVSNWIWPDAKQVQAMLQQRLMQATLDPAGHAHDEPLEIDADAISREPVTAVRVQFPDEFQNVLVVWYRPSQVWVQPKMWSPALRFP